MRKQNTTIVVENPQFSQNIYLRAHILIQNFKLTDLIE